MNEKYILPPKAEDIALAWNLPDERIQADIAATRVDVQLLERMADGRAAEEEWQQRTQHPGKARMARIYADVYAAQAREQSAFADWLQAILDARQAGPQRHPYHVIYTDCDGTHEVDLSCPSRAHAEAWVAAWSKVKEITWWEIGLVLHQPDPPPCQQLQPGTQVIYCPPHVLNGDATHPDCAAGFVSTAHPNGTHAWVKYWLKHAPAGTLRSRGSGELTRIDRLIMHDTVPQDVVDQLLGDLAQDPVAHEE